MHQNGYGGANHRFAISISHEIEYPTEFTTTLFRPENFFDLMFSKFLLIMLHPSANGIPKSTTLIICNLRHSHNCNQHYKIKNQINRNRHDCKNWISLKVTAKFRADFLAFLNQEERQLFALRFLRFHHLQNAPLVVCTFLHDLSINTRSY